jgi:3-oxoacyl-[acyl-carrier protein] reductase
MEISSAQSRPGYSQTLPGFLEMAVLAGVGGTGTRSRRVNHLFITGGRGGVGRAVIQAFAAPDWEITAPGREQLDMQDPNAIRAVLESVPVDLLVCAAGSIRDAPLARMDESMWDEVFSVNFTAAAACAAAVLPGMIRRGGGHIVFISSYSALHPPVGQAAYATAKAALLGLTESFARENGRHGVRVNAILPGFLETGMTSTVIARRKAAILGDHALGRFNTSKAVAEFIRFLHDKLPDTSGQAFQLDSRPA